MSDMLLLFMNVNTAEKFLLEINKHATHIKNCSGIPGVIYNNNTQNLVTLQDNYQGKGGLPFSICFDFETTSPTDAKWLNPEDLKMFVVSYVMIIAFHPALNIDKILIERSYAHSEKDLPNLNYLTNKQLQFTKPELVKKQYVIAISVSKRESKNAMGEMFCIESALVKKTLLAWFNKKYASRFKEIGSFEKLQYRKNNPIDLETAKCVICKMPLKIEPTNPKTPDQKMTYSDFIIRYEHKFLRNIYTTEQIQISDDLKNIESYYEVFIKFIAISTELNSVLSQYTKTDMRHMSPELEEFMQDIFGDDEPEEIKNRIMQTEIKNALSTSYKKVPKFNLKITLLFTTS